MTDTEEAQQARRLLDMLAEVWQSTLGVLEPLDEAEWAVATDCPGWTVKDVAAHVIGIESMYSGRETPDVGERDWPHVRNDIGRMVEPWVEAYRPRDPSEVLEDFATITAARLRSFRELDDAGWAEQTFTPAGPGSIAELIPFRLFDSWAHEQDIRRAVGVPGDVDSAAGRWNVERSSLPLAMVVAKRVGAVDGTTVEWLAHGPPFDHRWRVEVRDGRGTGAAVTTVTAGVPTVRIVSNLETFVRLGMGRVDPQAAIAARIVGFVGDAQLGERIVEAMAFTP